jgi:hypothetical protein
MVSAGVIPSGAHFDRREVSGSTLSSIISTYSRKPSNCKILVMDGVGIDLFSTPLGPSSTAVTNVVNQFKTFLQTLKTDGYVQHIIYSLYPVIPSTRNLNANMGPGFGAAAAAAAARGSRVGRVAAVADGLVVADERVDDSPRDFVSPRHLPSSLSNAVSLHDVPDRVRDDLRAGLGSLKPGAGRVLRMASP